jgi:outer membrane protein assembly factor BamB
MTRREGDEGGSDWTRRRVVLGTGGVLAVGAAGCLESGTENSPETADGADGGTTGSPAATTEPATEAPTESESATETTEESDGVTVETTGDDRVPQVFVDARNTMHQPDATAPGERPQQALESDLAVSYYNRIGRGPLVSGTHVYLDVDTESVVAISRADGSISWRFSETSADPYSLTDLVSLYGSDGGDGEVLVVGRNGRTNAWDIVGLDERTGEQLWTVEVPLVVEDDERVNAAKRAGDRVVVCTNGPSGSGSRIYQVDLGERRVAWEAELWTGPVAPEDIALTERRAFVTTDEAPDGAPNVLAFDLADRELLWTDRLDLGEGVPTVDDRHLYLPVMTGDVGGHLVAFDPADGTERWQFQLDSLPRNGVSVDGERVYAVSKGWLYALSAEDGEVEWSYEDPTGTIRGGSSEMPVVTENAVLTGAGFAETGRVRALDRSSGESMWAVAFPHSTVASPFVADGVLWTIGFGNDGEATLYALA